MDLRYEADQAALVTGGTKGIGAAIVRTLADEGVGTIHVVARNGFALAQLEKDVTNARVIGHVADLSRSRDRDELSPVLIDVDILVNNAGAIPQGTLGKMNLPAWKQSWELKLWGYLELTQIALAAMEARGEGVVVNVVGISGERPDAGYVAGSMANAALMTLTRMVGAYSIDKGVRCLGVNPGAVQTERLVEALQDRALTELGDSDRWTAFVPGLPAGRMATPQEVADTVVFAASARSSYSSGSIITVDGGMVARGSISGR